MQQTLEGIPADCPPSRFRLPDVWELTRRFSGIAAIAVLGAAMLTLAFRAEHTVPPTAGLPTFAQPEQAPPADATLAPAVIQPAVIPPARNLMPAYTPPEPTLVFYLYENAGQLSIVSLAESVAGQEAANDTVVTVPTDRRVVALDVSTPELDQAARDAIIEAMLANGESRVLIHDLRDR